MLLPHEDLRKKIHAVQAAFCEKYKVEARNSGRSHLTLALFTQYEMLEDRMVSHLKNIAMGFCPFAIDLKDYGSLPSHSIFINVGTEPVSYTHLDVYKRQTQGFVVKVFEKNAVPGGKLSMFEQDGYRFDAGPSLFTQPANMEELFAAAGEPIQDYFNYKRMEVACTYFFESGKVCLLYTSRCV